MFDGTLQVLIHAWPPNSQLLFCEPEKAHFFKDVDKPVGPQGGNQSKSWIKQILRIWLMRRCQLSIIPQFWLLIFKPGGKFF